MTDVKYLFVFCAWVSVLVMPEYTAIMAVLLPYILNGSVSNFGPEIYLRWYILQCLEINSKTLNINGYFPYWDLCYIHYCCPFRSYKNAFLNCVHLLVFRVQHKSFLISNFRRVLNLVCIFWVFPRRPIVVCRRFGTLYQFHLQGLKMELIEGSETSANHNRTPGKYPKNTYKI